VHGSLILGYLGCFIKGNKEVAMWLDREALKLWAVIALLAAVVASIHVAFVVNWAAKRDAMIWERVSQVESRLEKVEAWKAQEMLRRDAEEEERWGAGAR
jgi:hypothetical protein